MLALRTARAEVHIAVLWDNERNEIIARNMLGFIGLNNSHAFSGMNADEIDHNKSFCFVTIRPQSKTSSVNLFKLIN